MTAERVRAWGDVAVVALQCAVLVDMLSGGNLGENVARRAGRAVDTTRRRARAWYLRQLPALAPAVIDWHVRQDAPRVIWEADDLCASAAP